MSRIIDSLRQALVSGDLEGRKAQSRVIGTVSAVVTNNVDPEDRYRVKVTFPWLDDSGESSWAQVATPLAGSDYGAFFLPEVGDTVVVSFLDGDPERPVIVGSVWNGDDKPPQKLEITKDDVSFEVSNNNQDGKNDVRFIRSRGMHALVFRDTDGEGAISLRTAGKAELLLQDKGGEEKIQLLDQDRKQWLEIDVAKKKITLQSDTGEIYLKAKTKITLECEDFVLNASKEIAIGAGTSLDLEAGTSLDLKASSGANLEGGTTVTIKGTLIKLN
jgi:uncharacterized protein involved in type VI secretion and phage assembly